MNRNGNSANFFSYVCNGKKSKELFASTLHGIAISVRCVSSIIVVLNAKFSRLFAAHANIGGGENRISPTKCRVLLVETDVVADVKLLSQFWLCTQKNESIIYFPTIFAS